MQQVCDFDREDGLSVALSYGYDFTKIEEMERHICVPQNMHESALALQALQTVPMMQESFTLSWTVNG